MKTEFPDARSYTAEAARFPARTIVDIQAEQRQVSAAYGNTVLLDVNGDCMRLAVFEGEYRWHYHPDSDELFLVVAGELQIDFDDGVQMKLGPWQCLVVPAGTVHRTRAIGRTVNVTFEKQQTEVVFL
jgi:mannose-6-phosphate isomerase-like protein (cupin superfamily)